MYQKPPRIVGQLTKARGPANETELLLLRSLERKSQATDELQVYLPIGWSTYFFSAARVTFNTSEVTRAKAQARRSRSRRPCTLVVRSLCTGCCRDWSSTKDVPTLRVSMCPACQHVSTLQASIPYKSARQHIWIICDQVEGLLGWLDKRVSYFTITQFAGLIRCELRLLNMRPALSAVSSSGNHLVSANVEGNDASSHFRRGISLPGRVRGGVELISVLWETRKCLSQGGAAAHPVRHQADAVHRRRHRGWGPGTTSHLYPHPAAVQGDPRLTVWTGLSGPFCRCGARRLTPVKSNERPLLRSLLIRRTLFTASDHSA